jgi:hypothetical protein
MSINKYENSVIYKLYADDIDLVYIGSTTDIERRMYQHRFDARHDDRNCQSVLLYSLSDYEVKYEILELYPCTTRNEKELRERYWILQFDNAVNLRVPADIDPSITGEVRQKELARIARLDQTYRDRSRCISRKWRDANADYKREQAKLYRDANEEHIRRKGQRYYDASPVITCECGQEGKLINLKKPNHLKSKKHQDWLKSQN